MKARITQKVKYALENDLNGRVRSGQAMMRTRVSPIPKALIILLAFSRPASVSLSTSAFGSSSMSEMALVELQSQSSGFINEMIVQMAPLERMATRLPVSIISSRPRLFTETPPSAAAYASQEVRARTNPEIAPTIAPVAEHLRQAIDMATGMTAEPIMTPMNKYNQPRPIPIWLRIIPRTPMRIPKMTMTTRDTRMT